MKYKIDKVDKVEKISKQTSKKIYDALLNAQKYLKEKDIKDTNKNRRDDYKI